MNWITRIIHLDFAPFADLDILAAYTLLANVVLFSGLLIAGHPLLDTVFAVLAFEA